MMLPKYRAWDKDEKRMGWVVSLGWNALGLDLIDAEIQFEGDNEPEYYQDIGIREYLIFMLSIGQPDKAGKEIYAGDILKTDEAGWVGTVVYRYGSYMLIDDKGGFSDEPNWGKCEIIGTIHQHPELLEGKA